MMKSPLVTVVIPTYNYGHYICEAVDSVLASNFPMDQVEIIVVDDGSTDNTSERLLIYRDKVKYIYQSNSGKAYATKVAIQNSTGQYIFNLDADDFFFSEKIGRVVEVFEADSSLVHVAHPAVHWNIDEDTKKIENIPVEVLGKRTAGKELLSYFYRNGIQFGGGSTFAARAENLRKLTIPKEVDMYIDEFMLLATLNQGNSFFDNEPLSVWRVHNKNFSVRKSVLNQKFQRSLASVEAVLNELPMLGIDEEIQRIYQLKSLGLSLALKEQLENKTVFDILTLGIAILDNASFFGLDILGIAKNLKLTNRFLPNFLINKLKKMHLKY